TVGAANNGSAGCGQSGTSPDVWYEYTAGATGTVTVTTCAPAGVFFYSVPSGHTTLPRTIDNEIPFNTDSCRLHTVPSTISFAAVNGTTYWIRVAGWNNATGDFTLTVSFSGGGGGGPPPVNDPCANAISVTNGSVAYTNVDATTDSPADCGSNGNDIW